jgi:hypothetical protein
MAGTTVVLSAADAPKRMGRWDVKFEQQLAGLRLARRA